MEKGTLEKEKYLKLKSQLEFPCFFPGPMEGVMTSLFCRAFHDLHLTSGWLTPYYRVTTNVPKNARMKKFLAPFMAGSLPVIVQLMGTDREKLTEVAKRMVNLGACGINLNFACPSKQVLSSGTGGAMLKDIDLMVNIIKSIKSALPHISVSAKLRSGFDDWQESNDIIPALIKTNCLDFIAVHFRTVKEAYKQIPGGIERMQQILKLCEDVPLIASGDVFSEKDIEKYLQYGCAGVMVARGILKDPFLIRIMEKHENAKISIPERRKLFFAKLQDIARENTKVRSRPLLLEYAGMMWGKKSTEFSSLKNLPEEEILDFKF